MHAGGGLVNNGPPPFKFLFSHNYSFSYIYLTLDKKFDNIYLDRK